LTRKFDGFLVAAEPGVTIPAAFFTDVLPGLVDLSEIQVTLAAFRLASEQGGIESPIAERALLRDRPLRTSLRFPGSPREPDRRIAAGLDLAASRGTLIRFRADFGESQETWYYVNTPANQALVAAMGRGAIAPPQAIWKERDVPAIQPERPNIFRLYEQNIGLLSPLLADQLIDALETYPAEWIEEAIAESVSYNRRSWRYIQRILEKWATEGREPAAPGRSRP
jgi:DNA replication protein